MLLLVLGICLFASLCLQKRVPQIINPIVKLAAGVSVVAVSAMSALAQEPAHRPGGEANLKLPDLSQVSFMGGTNGRTLLLVGIAVSLLGMVFGLLIYTQLKKLAVHKSMLEISELIYETCKTYLVTQGKFILILEAFIAVIIILYFGFLVGFPIYKVAIILIFSLIGIGG
ncbi:MAG: sodium-translocating pyrophosphatase, partial [Acidobacteria bacterium]|nr:sodium-translocating pyrophosphatase [Acidobacteriota bacterium]